MIKTHNLIQCLAVKSVSYKKEIERLVKDISYPTLIRANI